MNNIIVVDAVVLKFMVKDLREENKSWKGSIYMQKENEENKAK